MSFFKSTTFKFSIGGILAACCVVAVASSDAPETERTTDALQHITVDYPSPTTASGCATEQAAYAAAVATMNQAIQAAEDAYQAWLDCEMQGQHGDHVEYAKDAGRSVLR